jgi:hypothetical protein
LVYSNFSSEQTSNRPLHPDYPDIKIFGLGSRYQSPKK